MKTLLILLAAATMALGLMQWQPNSVVAQARESSSPASSLTGVVDLQAVLNGSKQFSSMQERQQARGQALQVELERRQAEVKAGQNQLDALGPGTAAWETKRREVLELAATTQAWEQISKQIEAGEQAREFVLLYKVANDAVATVASERELDVVLASSELPDVEQLARAERSQITSILQNRKVLYHSDRIDLTQAVLLRLNANP